MKNIIKHSALLVGLPFFLGWLFGSGYLGDGRTVLEWLDTISSSALLLDPTTTLSVLAVLLIVLGIVFFLGRPKKKAPPPALSPSPLREHRQTKDEVLRPSRRPKRPTVSKDRKEVAQEWSRLDDADKEVIREIVSQNGLWESDILALLEARGFLHRSARFDSVAERVSFVHCDFAGYHSIPPEYQAPLERVLASDASEGYQ